MGGTGGGRDGVWTGLGGVFFLGRDRGGAVDNEAVGDFGRGVEIARSAPLSGNPGLLAFCHFCMMLCIFFDEVADV